jgi:hypothetical protein
VGLIFYLLALIYDLMKSLFLSWLINFHDSICIHISSQKHQNPDSVNTNELYDRRSIMEDKVNIPNSPINEGIVQGLSKKQNQVRIKARRQ